MSDDTRTPVLIGYDGYDEAAAAIRAAGRLLGRRRAIVAFVWESLASVLLHADVQRLAGTMREAADEFDEGESARAREVAERGARLAGEAGFQAEALAVRGKPKAWPALLEVADQQDVAAIVVGSEGLGAVRSALLGSVSSALLHHSERPLLIVPRGAAEDAGGPVILAYDGSENALRAIESAAGLLDGREAIVQTVWTSYRATVSSGDIGIPVAMAAAGSERLDEELAAKAQRTAEQGAAAAEKAGLRARGEAVVERGSIYRTLLDSTRDRDAAVVVIGTRGQSAVTAALIGSVAMGLVHHAHVPLLVVPPPRT
jgi:nucleotide-binding universal stress UspA family protein